MAASCENFKLVYNVICNGKVPVSLYKSVDTDLSVFIAQIDGPLVNGFFCLATEAHDDDGLPHTLEHLVFLGSEAYPYKGVLDLLANRSLASGTNAWTDTDHTCYTITTAGSEGFLQLLPIYLDHILHPTLKESGYVTEVHHINGRGEDAGVVYCEMQARENTGESLVHLNMLRAMYEGKCGYKSETGGIMANLRNSTSHEKVVCDYHQQFYRPENLCLIITGAVQPEEVFEALKPVEEKLKKKGPRPPFERPWQSPVPPLEKSSEKVVVYPSDDEEYGLVTISWRGPMAKVHQFVIENSETCFGFNFLSVDSNKLSEVAAKLQELLKKICDGEEAIDMERISNLIHRRVLEALNDIEGGAHNTVAYMLIGQFLFGQSREDCHVRLNTIDSYQNMKTKTESFWRGMLQSFIQNKPSVVVIGQPSSSYMEQMGLEERERVEKQRDRLGDKGLQQCQTKLEESIAINEVEPEESILTSVSVPSTESIHFHSITSSSNLPTRPSAANPRFPLSRIPCIMQLDDFDTNFVEMNALYDTSSISLELRYYLPLLTEALVESPILRNGELIPHERVIAGLEKDTLYSCSGLGVPPGCFKCDYFPQFMVTVIKVEEGKYETGVQWLFDLLYNTQFTAERLKIIANRLIGNISTLKRKGFHIVRTILYNLLFIKDCNFNVASMLKQSTFLTRLLERLESEPDKVIAEINNVRNQLLLPGNARIHLSCDTKKLAAHGLPDTPWRTFWKGFDQCGEGNGIGVLESKMVDFVKPLDASGPKKVIVGVGDVESAYFLQAVPCISSYHHEDLPALMVLIQYLIQCEGPMWSQIRGLGLSYHYSVTIRPDLGMLYLLLAKATHVVDAYGVGQNIVQGYLSGENEFSEAELESARSSLIFEIIEEEKTVWDATHQSLLSYLRNVEHNHNKEMVKKVSSVKLQDLKDVGEKYLASLFDPSLTRCVVCVNPSKVQEVASDFQKLGVELTVLSSLEEDLLTQL
ncbi:hypothetical protein C0Q70_18320 [Pomacea canaliculata]|uniref:Presequence protease, mitochondrial n=1 Tax=Pomacea canaliculata TaxID=400727 RepID=A0A2T7NMX4_POMCA|nr:hypothetical protein C0Q70_18320 [Pomacea canaliculata]